MVFHQRNVVNGYSVYGMSLDAVCTFASVTDGLFGYAIGALFYRSEALARRRLPPPCPRNIRGSRNPDRIRPALGYDTSGYDSMAPGQSSMKTRTGHCGRVLVLAFMLGVIGLVPASAGQPETRAERHAAPEPTLLDRIAHWLDRSAGDLKAGVNGTKAALHRVGGRAAAAAEEAAKGATGAAEDTVGSIAALPHLRVVAKRERCPSAANGAPDCQRAAEQVCRGKGLRGGKSLDIQTEERCPLRVLLAGEPHPPGACRTETFLTRAMCQ